jgi:hypothetical protein
VAPPAPQGNETATGLARRLRQAPGERSFRWPAPALSSRARSHRPSGDGWRGYVWCTRPDGTRYRKYVRGKTYDEVRQNWMNLRDQASRDPVSSSLPKLEEFLA